MNRDRNALKFPTIPLLAAFLAFSLVSLPRSVPNYSPWSVLREGVENKDADKRVKAITALEILEKNSTARSWAENALRDDKPEVRVAAANALSRIGTSSSRSKLKEALKDDEVQVVVAAANALYALKDPAAYQVYYALLTGGRKSADSLLQTQLDRLKDRRALEQIAVQTGIGFVPFGGMGYEAWKMITKDPSTPIRAAAAKQLANDPDPKSARALVTACSDKKWRVRAAAIEAIALRGDPKLVNAVLPLLNDDSDDVRYQAAAAIIHLDRRRRHGRHHV